MSTNPVVKFLAAYGPKASSNNLYDEFVVEAARKTGCAPLQIDQPLVNELVALLRSDAPKSVILTGTAGDGKTFTARKVAEALSETGSAWANTDKIFDLSNPPDPGRRIRFIKDLSELNDTDKKAVFPDIASALTRESPDLFVICVNDGHLLKFFRDHGASTLHDDIADMLRRDDREHPGGGFRLINMSRQSHQSLVSQIVDGVVNHPGWSACADCPFFAAPESPCPIQCNLEILRRADAASMRARLQDMIRMSAADGRHLSIRQLILLTVNILLGDRKGNTPLLTCQRAKNRAQNGDYAATNPYANTFGANLTAKERGQYGAFSVLSEFQVGFETNNYFDQGLLWEENDLPACPSYGNRVFSSLRDQYRGNPSAHATAFQNEMVDQRRRLFFSIDPESAEVQSDPRRDPWNLTIFKHGAAYIAMVNTLLESEPAPPRRTARSLLRGLNRIMTGEMTTTDDRLWLTAPSGVYLGREVPLLVQHAGPRLQGGTCILSFRMPADDGKPAVLRVTPMNRDERSVDLALRPTLVECLLRIADGALPASFSSECQREIERFQLRVASAVTDALGGQAPTPKEVTMTDDGQLRDHAIAIMTQEEEAW